MMCVFPQNTRERWGKEPDECEEEELQEILVSYNNNNRNTPVKCSLVVVSILAFELIHKLNSMIPRVSVLPH